jgi:uncharacterized protein
MLAKVAALTIVFVGLGAGAAGAASFDCRAASRADEIAVCDSRELSQLDVKMATLYDTVTKLVGMGVRGALQDQQRAFLNDRGACGPDRTCIRNLYEGRIRTLEAEVGRIQRGGPY